MTIHGKRVTLQAVNDSFDLVFDGTMFQVLWEQEKKKNAFTWENKNRRHDPYAVHDFGDKVDRVVAPTTREAGSKQAINLQVMQREGEESKTKERSRDMSENARKRGEAVAELDREKDQMYADLKSSIGEQEAKVQIKMYMRGHYKQKMAEIESMFPKSAKRPKSSTGREGAAAAQGSSQEDQRAERRRRRQEDEKANEEPAFESGFDHGFESMATFNGRSVGNDGGPAQSSSIINVPEPTQNT